MSAAARIVWLFALSRAAVAFAPQTAGHAPPVTQGMRSFGTAIKEANLIQNQELVVFQYNLTEGATHGAITQQWHAGKPSGITPTLRIRVYVDGEANASVDYPLFLAHGAGPAQTSLVDVDGATGESRPLAPWASALFGRTHDSGWYNTFLIPFGKSVRVTLTITSCSSKFWYMIRGVENAPLVISGVALPPSTRLRVVRHTDAAVRAGSLVTFANVSRGAGTVPNGAGAGGLLRQVNLVVNSSHYKYQEGCVSALVDGGTDRPNPIWLSSGLEDFFLGAYFHSMPTHHLPYSGFQLNATKWHVNDTATNSLSAYRIFEHDALFFTESLRFQWIAESNNAGDQDHGFCNFHWPETRMPKAPPRIDPTAPLISVDALAWIYTWAA